MPCELNLGDVKSTSRSKEVLRIGSFDSVYADNVVVSNGKIVADSFRLTSDQRTSGYFLKQKNDKLSWEEQHYLWVYEPNIYISNFLNTNSFAITTTLSSFAYDGDIYKLSNLPRKDQTIPTSYDAELKLFSSSSNLNELIEVINFNEGSTSDIFGRVNQLFDNTLGNLSYEQEILPKVNKVHVEHFHLLSEVVQDGFLYSSNIVDDELMVRNKVCWNNPFLNQDLTLKNEYKLIHNFLEDTTDLSSVEISNIPYFKDILLTKIHEFQNNLDIDRVKSVITENVVVKKAYLERAKCLGDVDDLEKVYNLFNIGTVASEDTEDAHIDSIEVTSKLIYKTFDTDDFTNLKFYTIWNSNVIVSDLDPASTSNVGSVYLHNSFEDLTLDSLEHEVPNGNLVDSLRTETNEALELIRGNLRYFFDELEDPPDGILDSNLSGYEHLSNIDLKNLGVYENLKIPQVCYTNNFKDLLNIPQYLDQFTNDIPLLEKSKSFGGDNQLNHEEVMKNLKIGDISLQNDSSVIIDGGKMTTNNTHASSFTVVPPIYTNIEGNFMSFNADDPRIVSWTPLQIGNETKYGIVKLMDSYKTASSDSVVKGNHVDAMYRELTDKLDQIESLMTILENSL